MIYDETHDDIDLQADLAKLDKLQKNPINVLLPFYLKRQTIKNQEDQKNEQSNIRTRT